MLIKINVPLGVKVALVGEQVYCGILLHLALSRGYTRGNKEPDYEARRDVGNDSFSRFVEWLQELTDQGH